MTALRLASVLWVVTSVASAQPAELLDEGTFRILRAGATHGTEMFRIIWRQGAEGPEFVAQCTRTVEGQVIKTALTIDSAGNPVTYTRVVTGALPGQISVLRNGGRLTVDEVGARASSKDYMFTSGTRILDDDLVHQLYFVTWRESEHTISYVAPGSRTAGEAQLVQIGNGSVTIGTTTLQATHFVLGTGNARRDFWVDSRRRLLKVSTPSQGLEATRELPPP